MAENERDTQADREAGSRWMDRITRAGERERTWMKDAAHAEKVYSCDTDNQEQGQFYDFNILFSNIETIVPAIYNSTPSPDVRRRFGDKDEAARDFAEMIERAISIQIDDNRLDSEVEAAAQDSFLAGRGIIRLRFESDVEDEDEDAYEAEAMPAPGGGVENERVTYEAVSWRDYRQGKAKRWADVPWVAFKLAVDREELERITDVDLYRTQMGGESDKPLLDSSDDGDDIVIWEVWCKTTRTVKWIRESDSIIIKKVDDPLGLDGFYPMPEPVQPIRLTGRTTPVCPFVIYKKLADELDMVTKRIRKVMDGVKVRGLQAGIAADDMTSLAEADDNEIVFAANLEQFAATRGLDNAITWWPVEQGIKVLSELYKQREVVKQSIYEITGISDIVRGASDKNETLGAQQIKTQWGSLRIQKMQRLIQRQVRDLFVMTAEIITTKFGYEKLQAMTGTVLFVEPQPGMDPQIIQAQAQKAQALLEMLQEPVKTSWRVDIESDSTIKSDMSRVKGEMAEFLNGTAQFFSAMAPLVQQSPQLGQTAAEIYGAFARNYQLGKQAESSLDQLADEARQAAKAAQEQQQQPSPEQQEGQAKLEQAKIGVQKEQINLEKAKVDLQAAQAAAGRPTSNPMEDKIKLERERVNYDKSEVDLTKARVELAKFKLESAVSIDDAGNPIPSEAEQGVMDRIARAEQLEQEIKRVAQAMEDAATVQAMPKTIEYDEFGRVSGIRTSTDRTVN